MWQRQADSGIGATHRADPFDGKARPSRRFRHGQAMLDMREHRVEHFADYEKFLRGVTGGLNT